MKMAIVSGTTLVTTIAALSGSAGAQTDSASIQAGRQLADTQNPPIRRRLPSKMSQTSPG